MSEEVRSIPMELRCPNCGIQHVDEGEWATRPHKTHMCVGEGARAGCGFLWKPSDRYTVGVKPLDDVTISTISRKRRKAMQLDEASQRLSLEQFFRLPVDARDVIRAYEHGARLAHAPRISELRRAYKEMVNRCSEYDVGDDLWHWEIALHVALARIVGIKVAASRTNGGAT